jgi:YD repeat-containing protein
VLAASRVLTASDFDGTYTMTYDAAGHVATANDVWNNLLTFTYDSRGNRTKVEDSQGGVTTSVYDADNRLISEQFGGVSQTPLRVDYTYDADGQLTYLTRYSNLAGTALVARTQYTYNVELADIFLARACCFG